MIFVSVGSMFPFERLVRTVDEWSNSRGITEVLVQIGSGEYVPHHVKWIRSLSERFPVDGGAVRFAGGARRHGLAAGGNAGEKTHAAPAQNQGARGAHYGSSGSYREVDQGRQGIWIADDETHLSELLDDFLAGRICDVPENVPVHASAELIQNVRRFLRLRMSGLVVGRILSLEVSLETFGLFACR